MPWLLVILSLCWCLSICDFCLCWVDVLFLDFCFLSGFSESVAMCCLFSWPAQLVCSQGMFAGVGGWDVVISGEREFRRDGWFMGFTEDEGRGKGGEY